MQYLIPGAMALAIMAGRLVPSVYDVKKLALPVLRHRIITNFNAESAGVCSVVLISRLVS